MIEKNLIKISVELLIEAEPYQIFNALTTGTAIWWGVTYLERKESKDLIMEPKIGGLFYERWSLDQSHPKGALHATVTAIEPPYLLRLQGPFGMSERAAWATASFILKAVNGSTQLQFSYHAFGELDEAVEAEYARNWHDLLGRLKFYVEEGSAEGIKHDPSLALDS